jgi:hypothetical protein
VAEERADRVDHLRAEEVLELAGARLGRLAEHVLHQPLGEPVRADELPGPALSLGTERDLPVGAEVRESLGRERPNALVADAVGGTCACGGGSCHDAELPPVPEALEALVPLVVHLRVHPIPPSSRRK